MELKREVRTAQNDKGESYSYDVYYVEIKGIKVDLKPKDSTAKQLLKNELDK